MRVLVCQIDASPCPESAQQWVDLASVLLDPAVFGLDAQTVLLIASYGAVPVLGGYLLGWGISLCKGLISKL